MNEPEALAEALAWLYLRKERHAARVTQALEPGRAALPGRVENAITALSVRTDDLADPLARPDDAERKAAEAKRDTRVEHRDGLLFQHVSWIAAFMRLPTLRRRRRMSVKPTRDSTASCSKLIPPRPRCHGSCSARTRPRSIPNRW